MSALTPLRFLVRALTTDHSPTQMALGFALGLLIGLVPKGNLLAAGLMICLGALRVNLGVGMLTALCVSWLGLLLDPLTHRIGQALLNAPSLAPLWTELFNLPLLPWTRFNNTVVLGSFVTGLALLPPAFLISRPLFARWTPDWSARLRRWKLWQLLWGGELTTRLN